MIAVATGDPFDLSTFSGYSANLFRAIADFGVDVVPMSSRNLTWRDALTGAVDPVARLRRKSQPGRAVVRPNWYWSRRSFERFCRRFDDRLAQLDEGGAVLQVGTHVRTTRPGFRLFCVTDATVVQAAQSGRFSIGQVSRTVMAEAIDCQREVLSSCEKVFVLSRWAADSVVGDYGYPQERVVVVGAGANLPAERPPRLVVEPPYVLFVGQDWERKGGPLLLDAFRRVRAAHPTARLKIVGCSPETSDDGVDVVGFVDKRTEAGLAQLLDLYAGATCFCLLSDLDPFPNVILEAGYLGVPVVSTDEGSRSEVIDNGRTGILVANRSPETVARAILSLFEDPERAAAIGAAAQRFVEDEQVWPVVARRVLLEMGWPEVGYAPGR